MKTTSAILAVSVVIAAAAVVAVRQAASGSRFYTTKTQKAQSEKKAIKCLPPWLQIRHSALTVSDEFLLSLVPCCMQVD